MALPLPSRSLSHSCCPGAATWSRHKLRLRQSPAAGDQALYRLRCRPAARPVFADDKGPLWPEQLVSPMLRGTSSRDVSRSQSAAGRTRTFGALQRPNAGITALPTAPIVSTGRHLKRARSYGDHGDRPRGRRYSVAAKINRRHPMTLHNNARLMSAALVPPPLRTYRSQPMPSRSPSKRWGSRPTTRKLRWEISPQSRSGGGGGMHTSGYEGSQRPVGGAEGCVVRLPRPCSTWTVSVTTFAASRRWRSRSCTPSRLVMTSCRTYGSTSAIQPLAGNDFRATPLIKPRCRRVK